jgi:hypothetical protein
MCLSRYTNPNCIFTESPDFPGVVTCTDCCRFGSSQDAKEFFASIKALEALKAIEAIEALRVIEASRASEALRASETAVLQQSPVVSKTLAPRRPYAPQKEMARTINKINGATPGTSCEIALQLVF